MPYHVDQDGLKRPAWPRPVHTVRLPRSAASPTYGDKYTKKTPRMGDLLHPDDSVKKRLVTMVDPRTR